MSPINFRQIYQRVQNYVDDSSASTLSVIKETINQKTQEIMQRGMWLFASRLTTVTTSTGVSDYYVPADVDKIIDIYQTATPLQLKKVWIGDFDRLIPFPQAMAAPRYYMDLFEDRVLAQPVLAHKIIASSNNNSDQMSGIGGTYLSGSMFATIYGVSNGVDRYELLKLSGVNVISSTNTWTKLYSITPDYPPLGTLRFTEETAGTLFLQLYPNEYFRSYKKFKVHPIPDQTYELNVRYQCYQPRLVNDSDVFVIPDRFADVVYEAVVADLMLKQSDAKFATHQALYEQALQRMTKEQDLMYDYNASVRPQDYGANYIDSSYPFSYF